MRRNKMSEKRTRTTLSFNSHAGKEGFMGDNTVIYVNINIHALDADGLVDGIIAGHSIHLTESDAEKLVDELTTALASVKALQPA
jgi:hypothetical protein